jgi:hypothetical protein
MDTKTQIVPNMDFHWKQPNTSPKAGTLSPNQPQRSILKSLEFPERRPRAHTFSSTNRSPGEIRRARDRNCDPRDNTSMDNTSYSQPRELPAGPQRKKKHSMSPTAPRRVRLNLDVSETLSPSSSPIISPHRSTPALQTMDSIIPGSRPRNMPDSAISKLAISSPSISYHRHSVISTNPETENQPPQIYPADTRTSLTRSLKLLRFPHNSKNKIQNPATTSQIPQHQILSTQNPNKETPKFNDESSFMDNSEEADRMVDYLFEQFQNESDRKSKDDSKLKFVN